MRNYLDAPHLRALATDAGLFTLTGKQVEPFFAVVEAYPWRVNGLNWDKLHPHLHISLVEPGAVHTLCAPLAEATRALVLVYSEHEAIGADVMTMMAHLDTLVWRAPGRRYFVGASRVGNEVTPIRGIIIEYDGADTIRMFLGNGNV